jgi:hypothetical protein
VSKKKKGGVGGGVSAKLGDVQGLWRYDVGVAALCSELAMERHVKSGLGKPKLGIKPHRRLASGFPSVLIKEKTFPDLAHAGGALEMNHALVRKVRRSPPTHRVPVRICGRVKG